MNKCKLCESKEIKELEMEKTYYHCRNCKLIFIDEKEIVDPEEEKTRYEQHDNNHEIKGM